MVGRRQPELRVRPSPRLVVQVALVLLLGYGVVVTLLAAEWVALAILTILFVGALTSLLVVPNRR